MALQTSYTDPFGNPPHTAFYWKITGINKVNLANNTMIVEVSGHHDLASRQAGKAPLTVRLFSMTAADVSTFLGQPTGDAVSTTIQVFLKAIYNFLKSLPLFAGAIDV